MQNYNFPFEAITTAEPVTQHHSTIYYTSALVPIASDKKRNVPSFKPLSNNRKPV